MKKGKSVFGRRPVGITHWYGKKRIGKELQTITYVVQDFTSERFRGKMSSDRREVVHVTA
jgi:hypothetical protein